MTYFDSPKNKAMWDKEITRMEAERERRRQNGFKPDKTMEETGDQKKSLFGRISEHVRLITLEELERIVRAKKGLAPKGHGMSMAGTERVRESRVNERTEYGRELEKDSARYGAAAGRR